MSERKILVVGPAWVGDMVMAQTLFQLLKQQAPGIQVDVLAPPWTKPLLERMPEVEQSIDLPFGHGELRLRDRRAIGKNLRSRVYDQAIILPNSYKSALIPFWAKIPQRTGWVGEMRYGLLNDIRRLDAKRYPLMIQRFMALGLPKKADLPTELPRPALKIAPDRVAETITRVGLVRDDRPVLALCPGAEFGASKRWPLEYYAEVANVKLAQGWRVWVFGSPKDKPIADRIQALTDHRAVNLAGTTQLTEAVDLLALADCVVTNDSGLMHIAAALNRPTIAIYGSTSTAFTPPLSDRVKVLQLDLSCQPCFSRECPLKHFKCMMDLKPDQIVKAMESMDVGAESVETLVGPIE